MAGCTVKEAYKEEFEVQEVRKCVYLEVKVKDFVKNYTHKHKDKNNLVLIHYIQQGYQTKSRLEL